MKISEKEFKRRCDAVREAMEREGLKALLVFSQVQMGYAGAVRYFSNYHLTTRKEYLLLPLSGDPVLIVPTTGQRYNAAFHSWIRDIRAGGETESMIGEIVKLLKGLTCERETIGIAGLNTMPFVDHELLTRGLPSARFRDATRLLDTVRMVKSPDEIEMIQETAEIADRCYETLLQILRPGKNELEIMAEVDKVLIERGVEDILILTAKGPSFPGFIDHPGPYTFKEGDHYIFSVEISGPQGYWTQIIRPLSLGKPNPRYERLFEAAKAALETGRQHLTPGRPVRELVRAVSERVKQEGFRTGLWCGHGMGLDVGEGPGLFEDSGVELKENMVITLHPHVLSEDGKEGNFVGDTFVILKDGVRNFSRTPCLFKRIG